MTGYCSRFVTLHMILFTLRYSPQDIVHDMLFSIHHPNAEVKKLCKKWCFRLFSRNSFLNLDTLKSCDLIKYKDNRRDLAKSFKMSK